MSENSLDEYILTEEAPNQPRPPSDWYVDEMWRLYNQQLAINEEWWRLNEERKALDKEWEYIRNRQRGGGRGNRRQ